MIGDEQNSVARKFSDEVLGIRLRLRGIDVEFFADVLADNPAQRRWPSTACQMAVATSLSVKNVESAEFMTIISPASMRAAIDELRATYFSDMRRLPLEAPHLLPHLAIRIERKTANGE